MDYRASDTFPVLTALEGRPTPVPGGGSSLLVYRVLLLTWFLGALVPLGKLLASMTSVDWWRWLAVDLTAGSLVADLGPPMVLLAELSVDVTVLATTGAALLFLGRYLRS